MKGSLVSRIESRQADPGALDEDDCCDRRRGSARAFAAWQARDRFIVFRC